MSGIDRQHQRLCTGTIVRVVLAALHVCVCVVTGASRVCTVGVGRNDAELSAVIIMPRNVWCSCVSRCLELSMHGWLMRGCVGHVCDGVGTRSVEQAQQCIAPIVCTVTDR